MKAKDKILVLLLTLIFAITVPIFILFLFHLIFADFYTKGFLTGMGHYLVCALMIVANSLSLPVIIYRSYKENIIEVEIINKDSFHNRIILSFLVSILIHIVLSILIENPFKEPPGLNFM